MIILYIVCFGCYVLFTRQPDYFDSERTTGVITERNGKMVAVFSDGKMDHEAALAYPFLHHVGEQVPVAYETSEIKNAAVCNVIGYWVRFCELAASLFIAITLYWIATSVTKNPTPEALIEELEMGKKKPKKPKYD